MPTANDFFPSKYLKAEDLDADLTVTIRLVESATLKGNQGKADETKPVAYFSEVTKALILNKTNFAAIEKITGEKDSDRWNGAKITLTVMDVDSFGDVVSAIRVKSATADPLVQKYWKTIADFSMTQQEGRDHLKEFKGDFAKALAGLVGDDNTPSPEQLPPAE